jgi:predicted nucleotidyltransferase
MATVAEQVDFSVTPEKLAELIARVVAAVQPEEIIVFGSRARGEQRVGSDLDLAIIVEDDTRKLPAGLRDGIPMVADILVLSRVRFDEYRPWINTIEREIDRGGVRVYERGHQPASYDALARLC